MWSKFPIRYNFVTGGVSFLFSMYIDRWSKFLFFDNFVTCGVSFLFSLTK